MVPTIGDPARSVVAAAVLLAVCVPANALAAPDSGSAGTGSLDSGSADTDRVHPDNHGADCPDTLIVAVAGASDSTVDRDPLVEENQQIWGNWVANVTVPAGERGKHEPGTVGWVYVPYPSTYGGWPARTCADISRFDCGRGGGDQPHARREQGEVRGCHPVRLGRVSVGAEVVGRVARDIGHRDNDALVTRTISPGRASR